MKHKAAIAVTLTLLATPVWAQERNDIEDLRPADQRYPDNILVEDLPIGPVPDEFLPKDPEAASSISNEIFGRQADAAYGAYQRGYFLTALALALPRAEDGDAHAQTLIAEIYGKGMGIAQDKSRAASWYELASNNGDPLATFELAMLYQSGEGVERDRARAAELFGKAAEAGNIEARYNMGLLHIEGIYAPPNLIKAAELISEAAEAGITEARYDYAGMLIEGAGVPPDPEAAAEQLRLAAEDGMVAAQVDYATVLYLGRGMPRDRTAAANWYARAAEAGNPVAQNRYAKLLAVGEGIEADPETAAMWRALSRRNGFNDPQLDALLKDLPADTLAAAEERARFWPSAPPSRVAENRVPPATDADLPMPGPAAP
ncbi:tetratricopeptide repeat protein [Devosia sp.]|uniref:tetratricopeptide repeat protein n=1 Tax=Devosia sp. TaxID=1871048 RepID=UPI003A957EE0